jgi:ATP-binding cassette, subfamily F, member 3
LALITRDAPHMLILDEPTNHLDVDSREALVQALNAYDGAVVIVSHDRHMIELTADRLVLVDGGEAKEFVGSLDDYTDLILKGGSKSEPAPKRDKKEERKAAAAAREASALARKELATAEAELAKLTTRRSEIDRAMFDPASALPADSKLSMGELSRLHGELTAKIDQAEAKWMQASDLVGA